jgi:hypothetical protein
MPTDAKPLFRLDALRTKLACLVDLRTVGASLVVLEQFSMTLFPT